MSITCLAQTAVLNEVKKTVYAELGQLISCIGNLQTLWWLICTIFTVAVFFALIVMFRKNVNEISRSQLEEFSRARKYIPELYVELNRNMEYLRYFTHRNSWRKRVIREYNNMFSNTIGKQVKKAIKNPALSKRLPYTARYDKVMEAIKMRRDVLEEALKSSEENMKKYGEEYFFLRGSIYHTPEKLKLLYEQCEVANAKTMVVVGSAGNGKTNLLCKTVETIIANKEPCLFINARSIKQDCYDYVTGQLLPDCLKAYSALYLHLLSFLLGMKRKTFYIIIDAINENDSEQFGQSIGVFTDKLAKYKNVKVLYACRSEYFQVRYRKFFDCTINKPYIFHLEQVEYSDRAKETLLKLYRRHFNVSGPISPDAVSRMMHSLFLMRLFFEVNQNRTSQNLELRDAEIYKAYFDSVATRAAPFDFRGTVERISGLMISQKRYDGIDVLDLNLSTSDLNSFKDALDDNLIISENIHIGKGIAETSFEYVYFVFDELRDFCLARYVLVSSLKDGDDTYSKYFEFAGDLYNNHLSPIEGILKYGYYYFKTNNRTNLCKKILATYSDFDPNDVNPDHWMNTRQRVFHDFGIALIFQDSQNILEFEKDYIELQIIKEPKLYWEVFWYLLRNEYASVNPALELAVTLLVNVPYETTEKIVAEFFGDRYDRYRYLRAEKRRRIEVLCDWVGEIESRRGVLSRSIKQIFVILAALEPMEPEINRYEKYVLSEDVVAPIRSGSSEELKAAINELEEKQLLMNKNNKWKDTFVFAGIGDLG